MTSLLERVAPHEPSEDQGIDGPDLRGFWERFHDADNRRSENPSVLWASRWKKGRPYFEISHGWSLTSLMFGLTFDCERGTRFTKSRVSGAVGVGPWSVGFVREWGPDR